MTEAEIEAFISDLDEYTEVNVDGKEAGSVDKLAARLFKGKYAKSGGRFVFDAEADLDDFVDELEASGIRFRVK